MPHLTNSFLYVAEYAVVVFLQDVALSYRNPNYELNKEVMGTTTSATFRSLRATFTLIILQNMMYTIVLILARSEKQFQIFPLDFLYSYIFFFLITSHKINEGMVPCTR